MLWNHFVSVKTESSWRSRHMVKSDLITITNKMFYTHQFMINSHSLLYIHRDLRVPPAACWRRDWKKHWYDWTIVVGQMRPKYDGQRTAISYTTSQWASVHERKQKAPNFRHIKIDKYTVAKHDRSAC